MQCVCLPLAHKFLNKVFRDILGFPNLYGLRAFLLLVDSGQGSLSWIPHSVPDSCGPSLQRLGDPVVFGVMNFIFEGSGVYRAGLPSSHVRK